MALLLKNSRDIGNKFLFGHFMMGKKHVKLELPIVAGVTLLGEITYPDMHASQVMALKDKVAVCAYNNQSRRNAVIYTVNKNGNGSPSLVYGNPGGKNNKETIGYGTSLVELNSRNVYILPSEDMNDPHIILYIDWETGNVGSISTNKIRTYSCVAVGSVAFYASTDSGASRDGWFYDAVSEAVIDCDDAIKKPNTPGIVFGMTKIKDMAAGIQEQYLCACEEDGLYLSDLWHKSSEIVTEVNQLSGKILAFYKDGKVKIIELSTSGISKSTEICDTKYKARRSCVDSKNNVCYWTTAEPQQLWVTNGKNSKLLYDFGPNNAVPVLSSGSAFSSAVAMTENEPEYVYVVTTNINNHNGWKLYKVKLSWYL